MAYDPRNYVPDFSWIGDVVNMAAKAGVGIGQHVQNVRFNKEQLNQSRQELVDGFAKLGVERLGMDPEEAMSMAEQQVRKPGRRDFRNPDDYMKDLGDLGIVFDMYQQSRVDYDDKRTQNPDAPVVRPPPIPRWGQKPDDYKEMQGKWYDKVWATHLRGGEQTGRGMGKSLSVQESHGATGTSVPTAPPTLAGQGTPEAPARPIPQAPGGGLQLPTGSLPDPMSPANLMAVGAETGHSGDARFLIESQQKLIQQQNQLRSAEERASRAQATQLAQTFGAGFPEGTEVSARGGDGLQIPLGQRYERPQRPASSYGSGIPPRVRYGDQIMKAKVLVNRAIDDMGNYSRASSERRKQVEIIQSTIAGIRRTMVDAGYTPEQIDAEIAPLERRFAQADGAKPTGSTSGKSVPQGFAR